MTDLQLNVDLPHPPERVWRALTDRRLLSEWWLPTDLAAEVGESFRAFPPAGSAGLPAQLDIDVLAVDEPTVLIQRWSGDELHTQVSWEIVERPGGSQLRFTQNGFFGPDGVSRRTELRELYAEMLIDRLPAMLNRLASGSAELGGAMAAKADPHAAISRQRPGTAGEPLDRAVGATEDSSHRRVRLLSLIGAAVLVVLVSSAVAVVTRGGGTAPGRPSAAQTHGLGVGPQDGNPGGMPASSTPAGRSPTPSGPAGLTGTPVPGVSGSTSPGTESSPLPAGPTELVADYQTISLLGLGGFDTEVTVRNPGPDSRRGWTVVLVMPTGQAVENRSSSLVTLSQQGAVVTITPTVAQRDLAPNTTITFTVRSPALLALGQSVKSCTIDGQPCTSG